MKVAIMSDSHDHLANLEKAIDYINLNNISEIIFCGDFCSAIPVKLHFSRFKGPIHAVFGNTEDRMTITKLSLTSVTNLKIYGELGEMELENLKFAFTHYPEYAEALANTGKYDYVCHGHTHEARQEKINSTILINPGEIMGVSEAPRFVVLDLNTRQLDIVLIEKI
ncbi:MAG: metallophosphoesterase [Candidatus Dojkabacteria bacterium]